jgi:hypothetical protein
MIGQLAEILTDQAKAAAQKGAVFAAIGLVMLIGTGFLLVAIYMAIAASYGDVVAAMTLGGTLVTLSLIALAIMLQGDPGVAVDKPDTHESAAPSKKSEDDVLFDLLVHSAMTGYATGQGNKPRMQAGFDQMVSDLDGLGVFNRATLGTQSGQAEQPNQTSDTKMAG